MIPVLLSTATGLLLLVAAAELQRGQHAAVVPTPPHQRLLLVAVGLALLQPLSASLGGGLVVLGVALGLAVVTLASLVVEAGRGGVTLHPLSHPVDVLGDRAA